MLALCLSLLFTLYLIVPDGLFRQVFGYFVPIRSFVPTRAETLYRAVGLTLLPLLAAYYTTMHVQFVAMHPLNFTDNVELRKADYKLVASSLYSEDVFRRSYEDFWPALDRCARRQGRFLTWYYVATIFEGFCFGLIATRYGSFRRKSVVLRVLADTFLLPNISEWHILLTPFIFPHKRALVRADLLCTDGVLYDGQVSKYFLEGGRLQGILLEKPRRFDRKRYLEDREKGLKFDKADYWKKIPSFNFYVFADKILNINLNYDAPEALSDIISSLLSTDHPKEEFSVTINPAEPPAPKTD